MGGLDAIAMDQRSRREALIQMVQERLGINTRDADYVYEPEKVAQEMCNFTLKHSSDMKNLDLLREVDLFGLRDLDLRHHELSARRAPFDNAKLLLAPFKVNNGQTPYTVLLFDPLMDPLSGWWSKLSSEMLIVQNVLDLVEVGSLQLKAALDWQGKCLQGSTDSSNYTNLLKYYCGCRLQLKEGILSTSSPWKRTKTATSAKLHAEMTKPTHITWKQYALQLRDSVSYS